MAHLAKSAKLLMLAFLIGLAVDARADDLTVTSGNETIRVTALTAEILRIRISAKGSSPEDASWAVPTKTRAAHAKAIVTSTSLKTAHITAVVDPGTLAITIADAAGHVIVNDAARPLQRDGDSFTINKQLGIAEHIFGLGDKTGGLDRRGKSFVNWNTDAYGFSSSDDPLYKSIPFYVSSGDAGGAYGLLLDNTFRSWFDFGHRDGDVLTFGAAGGPIDYYVIAGPSVPEVVRRYTDLTGKAPLPPRWILGYQQSRWSYASESEVRDLAKRLRLERVPTDVIWLDIDYQDRNRPFTIDSKAFPEFSGMVHDLGAQGFRLVAITDMHVARAPGQGYAPYDSGMAGNHFLKNVDGSTYFGPVWPGPAVFPQFMTTRTREWWGQQFARLLDAGVAGIWNDMNEPAIFETPSKTMPLQVRHLINSDDFAPRVATHAEAHNVYGMQNTRATYEGLRHLRPNERAIVMTRASYAGGQRYAVTWTGDNSSSWDHLRLAVAQTLNLGLSGFSWTGTDIGGFTGGPSAELLTRWFEYGAFLPIMRDHAQKDAPRTEPWVDGADHLAIRRRYIEERYRLMPYLYALAETNARTGDPLARPVFYDFPAMLNIDCDQSMSFTLGGKLLVAGAPKPESPYPYKACLPAGGWYDYWTGREVNADASADQRYATLMVRPRLDMLPVFVRAGTVVVRQALVQSTSERPQGPLELHIYPGPDGCSGMIYDDDGHSMGFTKGQFLRQELTCIAARGGLTALRLSKRGGAYTPWWSQLRVTIHGQLRYRATFGGKAIRMEQDNASTSFVIPDAPQGATIALSPLS